MLPIMGEHANLNICSFSSRHLECIGAIWGGGGGEEASHKPKCKIFFCLNGSMKKCKQIAKLYATG